MGATRHVHTLLLGDTIPMNDVSWAAGRATPPAALEPPPADLYWFVPAERPGIYAVWWTVYGPGQRVGAVKITGGAVEWLTMKEFCGIFERPARRAAEQAATAGELPPA